MSIDDVRIVEVIAHARSRNASDLHLGGGERPTLRTGGRLVFLDQLPIAEPALEAFLATTLGADARIRLRERGTADGAVRRGNGAPYRIHAYRTSTGLRIALRLLQTTIPSLDLLLLPAIVTTFAQRPSGLVLFTGPTGSGKTTALAALIDLINRTAERNIVTVEDPVEYMHAPIRSLITHCEIGTDVSDYAEALRGFLRADPDVILVGEMRDPETMSAALTAAETGHLVFATLHTNDAPQTIDRIVDAFSSESQGQVRAQLAATLLAVATLRLVPTRDGRSRRTAAEILIGTEAVRSMIRDGKAHQLRNAISTGRSAGMQTLESHLSELVVRGDVTLAAAQSVTNRPAEVRALERSAAS